MQIWLDTADADVVRQAMKMGIVSGVTTNPSIIAKSKESLEDVLEKLLYAQPGPVAVQVTASDVDGMVKQGDSLYAFSNRILVKVPVTAQGLQAIRSLTQAKIPVMATAIVEPNQVLLAAHAGATYLAPYYSRMCEDDMNGTELLKAMLHLLHHYHFPSKLIVAALRSKEQISECAGMGADAITVNDKVFGELIDDHPSTKDSLDHFARDWVKAKERRSLLL